MGTLETRARKNVTMKDVALRAGTHLSSVSVVLNGSRSASVGVSAESRARIVEAAAELGYRRNGSAHTTRTGRFNNVAILLSPLRSHSYLPLPLLAGLHDALEEVNVALTFCLLGDEELTEAETLPKFLRERMCDGLLVDYNFHIPQPMVESIARHQIPAVWINSKRQSDCVYPDDFDAAKRATEHLIALGHRRIAYTNFSSKPDEMHYSSADRYNGYRDAMCEAELEPQAWGLEMAGAESIALCQKKLARIDRPTAILAYATYAFEGISYAAARLDLRVPEDLSIVTFGPEQIDYLGRPLSLMIEPQYEMGRIATQMIRQKIEAPHDALDPQTVRFEWASGQTTATCPSD